ncbi:hypothetical protein KJ633_03565, partial [bacterium]|nr:hypothetical protein [bacterium]
RNHYTGNSPGNLNNAEKQWLIDIINSVHFDYTLSFLLFKKNADILSIHVFDHDNLDISKFKDKNFELKYVAKERRPEVHIHLTDTIYLEISAGGNPYNRGVWINKVWTGDDMNSIYTTGLIEQLVPPEEIELKNFNKNKYVLDKAERTIEIIKEYF